MIHHFTLSTDEKRARHFSVRNRNVIDDFVFETHCPSSVVTIVGRRRAELGVTVQMEPAARKRR